MITETSKLMGMQKRQVYKWLWDEDLREKQRTLSEQRKINEENTKQYQNIFGQVEQVLRDPSLFFLQEIVIQCPETCTREFHEELYKFKLRDLTKEILILKLKEKKRI